MEEKTLNQDLENQKVEPGNTPETPQKKKGLKGFLQLVLFIVLSMAGFIVQVVIEQLKKLDVVQNFDATHNFVMFDIKYLTGSFIVTMIAIFVCKVINFILHRKVLFKPRHNLAFGIVMYIIFSVLLWLGSVSIQQPVKNAFVDASWWTESLFKGNVKTATSVADFLATMVYSTADLIIMFFAEKFLIMNDKLFQKKGQKAVEAPATENATPAEEAVAADSVATEEVAPAVEEASVEEKSEEIAQDIFAKQESVEEVKTEEPVVEEVKVEETPVEEVVATEEVAAEEVAKEEVVEAPAKKPAAKKTTTTAKKTTSTAAKKPASTAAKKTTSTAAKKPASTTAKKTTSTAAKKPASTAAKKTTSTAAKKPATTTAKKTTSTAAKKPATTTAKKTTSTAAKKPASTTAKKTTSTAAKKPATTAKKTTAKK